MTLRQLIEVLRESVGVGGFMGGGAAYPGPEPGGVFAASMTYHRPGESEPKPKEPTPPGKEREFNPKDRRRPLKFLGRKKADDGQSNRDER